MYSSKKIISELLSNWLLQSWGSEEPFPFRRFLLGTESVSVQECGAQDILVVPANAIERFLTAKPAAVIVCADSGDSDKLLQQIEAPVFILNEEAPLEEIYTEVLQKFSCEYMEKHLEIKRQLLDKVTDGCTLDELLRKASEFTVNPFIIYDVNYALVAHSVPDELDVAPARNVVKNGYANMDIIMQMHGEYVDRCLPSGRNRVLHVSIPNGYEKITTSIYSRNTFSGLLGLFNYIKPLECEDYEIVEFLGGIAGLFFSDTPALRQTWTPWNFFFYAISEGKPIPQRIIDEIGTKTSEKMQLLVISSAGALKTHADQPRQFGYIKSLLQGTMPQAHLFLNGESVVCLDSEKRIKALIENMHQPAAELMQAIDEMNLSVGISNSFLNLEDTPIAFEQATFAARIEKPIVSDAYEYKNHILQHMLSKLHEQGALEDFIHPGFRALLEYERQYETSFVEFLLVYFYLGCDKHACAKYYDIHYNSVKYRLNTIQEITGLSLSDFHDTYSLYLSSQINNYLHPTLLPEQEAQLKSLINTVGG